jgi:hypothetical protein
MFWHEFHSLFHVLFLTVTWSKHVCRGVTSSFRRDLDDNYALLVYYEASSGNLFPTFRDNLSAPSSRTCPSRYVITQKSAVLISTGVLRHIHVTFGIQGVKSQLINHGNWYHSKCYLTSYPGNHANRYPL